MLKTMIKTITEARHLRRNLTLAGVVPTAP